MDGAVRLEHRVAQPLDGLVVGDIGDKTHHVDAVRLELLHRGLERGRFDVGEHDLHALLTEPLTHGPADAAGAAGDDGHPPLESFHQSSVPTGDRSS